MKFDFSRGYQGRDVDARRILFDANLKAFVHSGNKYDWVCQLSPNTQSKLTL